jgi:hypothetical protein
LFFFILCTCFSNFIHRVICDLVFEYIYIIHNLLRNRVARSCKAMLPDYAQTRQYQPQSILHCSQVLSHRLKMPVQKLKVTKAPYCYDCTKSLAELIYYIILIYDIYLYCQRHYLYSM